jgi:NAD(P)-dependent dehydrogenase (short-subunit alcohol dehydrogenase family)
MQEEAVPMGTRVAIVTGGLRGLGQAMALGLAATGCRVVAAGHLPEDVAPLRAAMAARGLPADSILPMVGDIRVPAHCDELVAAAQERLGGLDILVNNAGLTFTYITPDKFRRPKPQPFWDCSDTVVQSVMDVNFVAADRMARRVAPLMIARGWGRIVNVTTKLTTMNVPGASPYGPSKAALEMATEIWAKEFRGTGVTANIVNPGDGANTPGMAEEWRAGSAAGTMPRLVEPDQMVPPLLFTVSDEADAVNGFRFDANAWDPRLPPREAALRCARPAGFVFHPQGHWQPETV